MSENKCPLCGGSVEENAKECQYCGASLLTDESGQQAKEKAGEKAGEKEPESKQEDPGQRDSYASDDPKHPYSYLPPYYQEEFEKMDESRGAYKGKWNWAAFLFSWIWGFTKGLWTLSLIALFISLLLNRMGWDEFGLALMLLWGVRGNYFYYQLVRYKRQIPNDI